VRKGGRLNCKTIDKLRMEEWIGTGVDEEGMDYDGGEVLEQLRLFRESLEDDKSAEVMYVEGASMGRVCLKG
jgi:hypothetical protein